ILIYLTNPNTTLPKLLSLLEIFSSISGYKLNISKTQILTFNYEPNYEIKAKASLKWETEQMKYLGVNITKDLSKTVKTSATMGQCFTSERVEMASGV
uniref:Reverse transcriptase domain-containing protein n=1 Tax=Pundamilia nyererei TaxID=303518 RepID=A0A3B4FBQ4_9CICH